MYKIKSNPVPLYTFYLNVGRLLTNKQEILKNRKATLKKVAFPLYVIQRLFFT